MCNSFVQVRRGRQILWNHISAAFSSRQGTCPGSSTAASNRPAADSQSLSPLTVSPLPFCGNLETVTHDSCAYSFPTNPPPPSLCCLEICFCLSSLTFPVATRQQTSPTVYSRFSSRPALCTLPCLLMSPLSFK